MTILISIRMIQSVGFQNSAEYFLRFGLVQIKFWYWKSFQINTDTIVFKMASTTT